MTFNQVICFRFLVQPKAVGPAINDQFQVIDKKRIELLDQNGSNQETRLTAPISSVPSKTSLATKLQLLRSLGECEDSPPPPNACEPAKREDSWAVRLRSQVLAHRLSFLKDSKAERVVRMQASRAVESLYGPAGPKSRKRPHASRRIRNPP